MSAKSQEVDEFSSGQRLDNYLIKHLKGVPKSHIYRIIRRGEVRVNMGRKKAAYKLKTADLVRIPPIRVADNQPQKPSSDLKTLLQQAILFEDAALLIINKPSGLAVHGGSGIKIGVIEALREIYPQSIELVHRIDRATSGVLMLAKKRSALKNLQNQLAERQLEKRYTALVKGVWSKKIHTVDVPLLDNSRFMVVNVAGKSAISHFQPLKNFTDDDFAASLVSVKIETGRMHQIRVHAKFKNHEIAADDKYGDKFFNQQVKKRGLNRLFLHAETLIFTNPTTNKIQKITAPLPPDLTDFLKNL